MRDAAKILSSLETDGLAVEEATRGELLEFIRHLKSGLQRVNERLKVGQEYEDVKYMWPGTLEQFEIELRDLSNVPLNEEKETSKALFDIIDNLKNGIDALKMGLEMIAPQLFPSLQTAGISETSSPKEATTTCRKWRKP